MKKIRTLLLGLVFVTCISACSSNKTATTTEKTSETDTPVCQVKIGLVTDSGGVDDKSFIQSAWEGLQQFAQENNADDCIKYLQSNSESDYIPNLVNFAEEKYDLVIAVGYAFADAINEVAGQFPDTNFLFIDSEDAHTNVLNALFSAEQGSYLVGIAAGRKAIENNSKTVGFIGGAECELIRSFQAGYEQGVLSVCEDCKIYVDYIDSYEDDAKGQQLASKQYGVGATVIYQVAGNAGNGVIKEAKERGDVWAIGVDRDQYEDCKISDDKSVILTSMIKRVDVATYDAATAVLKGAFTPGTIVFDLHNNGVSAELSKNRNLSDEDIQVIEEAAEMIKADTIKVGSVPTIANGSSN